MTDDKDLDRNMVTIGVSRLPESLRVLAWEWRQAGQRRVAARKDDAGECGRRAND